MHREGGENLADPSHIANIDAPVAFPASGVRDPGSPVALHVFVLQPRTHPIPRWFEDGEVILRQGDPGTALYVVQAGAVVVGAVSATGREVVLGVFPPGQMFGHAALDGSAHRGTARALGRTAVSELDPGLVVAGENCRWPSCRLPACSLLHGVAARANQLEEWLADLVLHDVPARVARRLSDLADGFGLRRLDGVLIDVPITQGLLAGLVGAARESVNRAMADLARKGVVRRVGGRYLVADEAGLRLAAGRPQAAAASPPPASPPRASPSRASPAT